MLSPALLLLADGRFPAGAHAYSAGVESAVHHGDVDDEAGLERFLHGRLATTGVTEAGFAAAACGAGPARLSALDAELRARILSPRLRAVGDQLGRQLLRAGRRALWPAPTEGLDGCQQPIVLGALIGAAGGDASDAAMVAMHHLATAVTTAAVRLLGLDPIAVAALQARSAALVVELVAPAPRWAAAEPRDLPAFGSITTEILGEDHGQWSARLFVA
jgi:urease accessory protein